MRNVLRTKLYSPCRTLPNILSFALNSSPPDFPMYLALTISALQSSTYISCLLHSLNSTTLPPQILYYCLPIHLAKTTTVFCSPRPTSPIFYVLRSPPSILFTSTPPHYPIHLEIEFSLHHDSLPQSSTYISCW